MSGDCSKQQAFFVIYIVLFHYKHTYIEQLTEMVSVA